MAASILLVASLVWIALLAGTASGTLEALSSAVIRFSSFICHQQPDRSFHWGVTQWAVCARCLGLYVAAPLGAISAMAVRVPLSRALNSLLLCIAAMPTAATWLLEHAAGWTVTNEARFAAALPLGAVVVWVIARTLAPANREYSTGMN